MSKDNKDNVSDIQFEKLFKIITTSLRIVRTHPEISRDWKWILEFIFVHGFYCLIVLLVAYCAYFHGVKTGNIVQASANGVLIIISLNVSLCYYLLVLYQQVFKNMISKMDNDFQLAKDLPIEEQSIILKYAYKGKYVLKIWLAICAGTSSLFPVKSIGLMTYYTIKGEFKFVHFYEMTYPEIIEERKNTIALFVFLYLIFAFFDFYSSFMIFGFSPLGPILTLHACGQIEIARSRILKIYKENNSELEIETKLKNIICFLQTTSRWVILIKMHELFIPILLNKKLIRKTLIKLISNSN